MTSHQRPFRKRVAAAWGCGLYLVLLLVTSVVGALTAANPEAIGEIISMLLVPTVLLGVGLAYWAHRGARRLPVVVGLVWVAALPGVIVWGWKGRRLGAGDRVPLEIQAGRVAHPTLGFSFPTPPDGFTQVSVPDEMQVGGDAMYLWSFVNDSTGDAILVIAGRQRGGVGGDWFVDMAAGIRDGVRREGGSILVDSVSTTPNLVYELSMLLADSSRSDFTCRASSRGTTSGVVACVGVVGLAVGALEPVRRGLTVP